MEIIGSQSITQDVQFLKMLDRFFLIEILLLDSYALLINFLGCAGDRALYREKLYTFLERTAPHSVQPARYAKKKI